MATGPSLPRGTQGQMLPFKKISQLPVVHPHGHDGRPSQCNEGRPCLELQWRDGGGVHFERHTSVADAAPSLQNLLQESTPFLCDFQKPSLASLNELREIVPIHPITMDEIVNGTTEHTVLFQYYRMVVISEQVLEPGSNIFTFVPITILFNKTFTLTFHHVPVESVARVWKALASYPGPDPPSPDWTTYALMDTVLESFHLHVQSTRQEIQWLDELVLVFTPESLNEVLLRISYSRKRLINLKTNLWSKKDMLETLFTPTYKPFIAPSTELYMRDVYDDIEFSLQQLEAAEVILCSLNSTYLARISILLSESANDASALMKKFSAVATITLPLTLIAGILGMNVPIPLQMDFSIWPFIIISICFLFIIFAGIVFFHKLQWW